MTPFHRRRNPYIIRMAEDMQIRNLAANTIDSYTWHVDKFCSYFGKLPEELRYMTNASVYCMVIALTTALPKS